jgi:hypothetical protein
MVVMHLKPIVQVITYVCSLTAVGWHTAGGQFSNNKTGIAPDTTTYHHNPTSTWLIYWVSAVQSCVDLCLCKNLPPMCRIHISWQLTAICYNSTIRKRVSAGQMICNKFPHSRHELTCALNNWQCSCVRCTISKRCWMQSSLLACCTYHYWIQHCPSNLHYLFWRQH